jgi:hypothetical protein
VFEHTELRAKAEVDRTAAELRVQIDRRSDADFALLEVRADVAVGETTKLRGILYQRPDAISVGVGGMNDVQSISVRRFRAPDFSSRTLGSRWSTPTT